MTAPAASLRSFRGIARYATVLCALAVIAAVVSFVNGRWFGIVWVLLAGLASNMAWYYGRRARRSGGAGSTGAGSASAASTGSAASRSTAAE